LPHELQGGVIEKGSVLDGCATRRDGGTSAFGGVGVHQRSKPCLLASSQVALIWSTDMVIFPPSRMLAVAKSLIGPHPVP